MGCAEVISLPEARARKQWEALRQQLHARFDRWLDEVEAQFPPPHQRSRRLVRRAGACANSSPVAWPRRLANILTRRNRIAHPCRCNVCASPEGAPSGISHGGDPDRRDRSAPPVCLLPSLSPRSLSARREPGFACRSQTTRRATGRGRTGHRMTV